MPSNPFYDAWRFITAQTSDYEKLGIWQYLIAILFLALIAASVAIALRNWREDPIQRTGADLATWIMRVLMGAMWYQGMLWKLPISTGNGLHYWTTQMAEHAAFPFYRDFVSNVLLPNFIVLNVIVFLAELGLAVSLLLGFVVRLSALAAVPYVLGLWLGLYGSDREWPWTYIFLAMTHAFFVIVAAGRSLGLDALIRRRFAVRGSDAYGAGRAFKTVS